MHELSIAYHLVEVASEAAARGGPGRVTALRLRLGVLSCVHRDALEFCYELAAQGTPVEGAQLVIEEVPVEVYCPRCRRQSRLDSIQKFCCPHCGQPTADIRQGKELELASIEIETEDLENPLVEGKKQDQESQQGAFSK